MTVDAIIKNWREYDKQKIREAEDTRHFDYRSRWEVDYFSERIKSIYPFIPEARIRSAIDACTQNLEAPCSREQLVENVIRRLDIPL
jgi:hypothetical protein